MKRVTASEARRKWFELLDEVARGEHVVIERNGRRITLLCEDALEPHPDRELPDYSALLQVPNVDEADRWSWRWSDELTELVEEPPS